MGGGTSDETVKRSHCLMLRIFAIVSFFSEVPYCRLLVIQTILSESRLMMVDTNRAYWFHVMIALGATHSFIIHNL